MIEITGRRKRHVAGSLTKRLTTFSQTLPARKTLGDISSFCLMLRRDGDSAAECADSPPPWEMLFDSEADVDGMIKSLVRLKEMMSGKSAAEKVVRLRSVT